MRIIQRMQCWLNIFKKCYIITYLKKDLSIIISTDKEKAFDKFQYWFMINEKQKPLNKLGTEGNSFNWIKGICEKPTADIILMKD